MYQNHNKGIIDILISMQVFFRADPDQGFLGSDLNPIRFLLVGYGLSFLSETNPDPGHLYSDPWPWLQTPVIIELGSSPEKPAVLQGPVLWIRMEIDRIRSWRMFIYI